MATQEGDITAETEAGASRKAAEENGEISDSDAASRKTVSTANAGSPGSDKDGQLHETDEGGGDVVIRTRASGLRIHEPSAPQSASSAAASASVKDRTSPHIQEPEEEESLSLHGGDRDGGYHAHANGPYSSDTDRNVEYRDQHGLVSGNSERNGGTESTDDREVRREDDEYNEESTGDEYDDDTEGGDEEDDYDEDYDDESDSGSNYEYDESEANKK